MYKMAKYKKKRNYRKRSSYRKKKKNFKVNSLVGISTAPRSNPLLKQMKARFRYSEPNKIFSIASSSLLNFTYSANGLYDPDYSSTLNHQPSGFDELMGFYNHYTVIGVKISCTFTNPNDHFVTVGIDLSDASTPSTDVREIIEGGTCTYGVLAPNGSGKSQKTFQMSINPNKFLGVANPLGNANIRGSTVANPNEQAYFHVFCNTDSTAPASMRIPTNVVIEYVAILTEPRDVGLS